MDGRTSRTILLTGEQLGVLAGTRGSVAPAVRVLMEAAARLDPPHGPALPERVAELERQANGGDPSSFGSWLGGRLHESESEARDRLRAALDRMREVIDQIDEHTLTRYVHDQLVSPFGLGARVREAVLMKVAEELRMPYADAGADEDADGYLAERPVSIRPVALREHHVIDQADSAHVHIFYALREDGGLDLHVDS